MEIIILLSLSLSAFLNLLFQREFLKKDILDQINNRSSHSVIASRSGGISIFTSLFIISAYHYLTGIEIFDFSFLVPLALLLAIGLYDDVYNLDFKLKFIFQVIAAKIIIDYGLVIDNFHGLFGIYELNRVFAQMLTMIVIVGVINAINFIDGIDGLAISIIILFLSMFEFFSYSISDFFILTTILISSMIPLYYFNFRKKKKVFLGDSGSLFLGGVVSIYVIHILSQEYIIKESYDLHKIVFVISILFYPIIDIIRIVFKRLLEGKSPFEADKKHIHHLILRVVKSHFTTTFVISLSSVIVMILFQFFL